MSDKKYYHGLKNKVIRYYFYTQKGLALCNEFRYLFMIIFGVYFTFKIQNPIFLVLMFIIAVPLLVFLGWLAVNHIDKVIEWLNIQYATVWSKRNFELNEKRNEILEEIKDKI